VIIGILRGPLQKHPISAEGHTNVTPAPMPARAENSKKYPIAHLISRAAFRWLGRYERARGRMNACEIIGSIGCRTAESATCPALAETRVQMREKAIDVTVDVALRCGQRQELIPNDLR